MLTKKQICKIQNDIKKNAVGIFIPYVMFCYLQDYHKPAERMALAEYTKTEVKQLSSYYLEIRYYMKVAKQLGLLDSKYHTTKLYRKLRAKGTLGWSS